MLKKLMLSAILIANSYTYLSAQEVFYVTNGTDVNINNGLLPTFSGGVTVASGTLTTNVDFNVRGGTITGQYLLQRLVVAGGVTTTINSSATNVRIQGSVFVTGNSTLTVQGTTALTLASSAASTAPIEVLTSGNSITGNINIERYIPGGRRAYRFFSHPFTSTQSISSTLMDNIDVTGSGGSTNGFTNTVTNNPSAWWFDPATANTNVASPNSGWQAFTNANNNNWNQYMGIYLMVRGAKSEGLTGGTYTPSAVTIDMSGPVNQGNQTISLTKGASAGYNLIGNPYPSGLNVIPALSAMSNKNGSAFWVWNANNGTKGAYEPVLYAASSYILPSNSAMMIDVTANTSVTFQESHKATPGTSLFKTTSIPDMMEMKIFSDSGTIYWDKFYLMFNPDAQDTLEQYDARKVINNDLNLGTLSPDSAKLCVDARSYAHDKIIPLYFDTKLQKEYELRVEDYTISGAYNLFLHDKYLNTVTQLSNGVSYKFQVTADSGSVYNRFAIGLEQLPANVVSAGTDNDHIKLYPNPAKEEFVVDCKDLMHQHSNLEVQIADVAGRVMYTGKINKGISLINVSAYVPGMYVVSVTSAGRLLTSKRIVKE